MHKEYATEWLVLDFAASGVSIVQDEEDWIDMEDFQSFAFTLVNPVRENVTAILETCRTREGPWTQIATIEATVRGDVGADADDPVQHVAADRRFDRFVRMRFESTDAGRICFRMTGILKA